MAISILYSEPSKDNSDKINERVIYHLFLDRSFSYICNDVKKRKCFLDIISVLTKSKSEIEFRQDVLRDMQSSPGLLNELISVYARFDQLYASYETTLREERLLKMRSTASRDSSKNILRSQALCLKRALLFVKAIGEILNKYSIKSAGLTTLRDVCIEIFSKDDFNDLISSLNKYEMLSSNGFLDLRFKLGDDGCVSDVDLVNHRYIHVSDPELVRKSFSFFKRTEQKEYRCERVFPNKNGFFDSLSASAMDDMSNLFSSISSEIFEKFGKVCRELDFYDIALKYINALEEKKIGYCYPKVLSDGGMKATGLYDLYLLLSESSADNIVPNDVDLSGRGTAVFGNNGSGKTVYLRSVGAMQVLAQAGLPVPCQNAEIYPHSHIATQFSEAEKEFVEGNEAGRFEQEVREFATMVQELRDGSLVLLNEPFQSTSYAEGAEGVYNILEYFSDCNISWILVSHLSQLEQRLSRMSATVMHTSEGYRLISN